jgi:hypothetical protein
MDLDAIEPGHACCTQRGTKMRSATCVTIAIIVMLLVTPMAGQAWGPNRGGGWSGQGGYHGGGGWNGPGYGYHGGGGWSGRGYGPRYGGGLWIGPGWGAWWWPPAYWGFPYPYYAGPPVVVEQSPPVYVQPAPQPEETYYWYYCQNPQGYYPYVRQCSGGWTKVAPSPASPGQ